MNKRGLKTLQTSRLLNMKSVYERAGLKVANINSLLSRAGDLTQGQAEEIENAIIDHLYKVVLAAGIDAEKLINRLGPADERRELVEPVYYVRPADGGIVQAYFLPEDRFKARTTRHRISKHLFSSVPIEKIQKSIQATGGQIEITARGQSINQK